MASKHKYTEGICNDGAAILKDGIMMPIEDVINNLNKTNNLVMLIKLLVHTLRENKINLKLANKAMDYLKQNNFTGSILR